MDLISTAEARKLIGRKGSLVLSTLDGFPEPVCYGRGKVRVPEFKLGYAAFYDRRAVEQWRVTEAARREAVRLAVLDNKHIMREEKAAETSPSIPIQLPTERELTLSMRRDLFDEHCLTEPPSPCLAWRGLLNDAGEKVDGRDASPATLDKERARDRKPGRMPGLDALSVGHTPTVARPSNPRLTAQIPGTPSRLAVPTAHAGSAGG